MRQRVAQRQGLRPAAGWAVLSIAALFAGLALFPPRAAWATEGLAAARAGATAPAAQGPGAMLADAIPAALHGLTGDARRGRALVVDRRVGLCLLCHSGPFPEERTVGDLSTDLSGVGSRWSEGQLRLRIVDARRLNPDTIMPPYHGVDGLQRVGQAWRDRPLFTAQQVEDVVAFLLTLK